MPSNSSGKRADQSADSIEKLTTSANACGNMIIAAWASSYVSKTPAHARVASVRKPLSFAALSQQTVPVRPVALTTNTIGGLSRSDAVIIAADSASGD
jgi:hypothetical protein